jgi:hypothetical protein
MNFFIWGLFLQCGFDPYTISRENLDDCGLEKEEPGKFLIHNTKFA